MNLLRFARAFRTPRLVLITGLVLVLAIVAGGLHRHDGDGAHPCGICSLSQAPATVVAAVADLAPARITESVPLAPELAPRSLAPCAPSTRGPPTA